jgi:hypothetical protein
MKTTKPPTIGDRVRVLPAFAGRDSLGRERFERDEFTGRSMYVVGVIHDERGEVVDFKLATFPGDPWEVIVHTTRIRRMRRRAAVKG